MASEADGARELRDALNALGYGFVQRQPRLKGSGVRPDVIAWASDESGELVPWAAITFKAKKTTNPDLLLPVLARSRDLFGTHDHYAVIDGQWFKADRGVRSFEPIDGPMPAPHGGGGFLKNEELATSLIAAQLWRASERRPFSERNDVVIPEQILYDTNLPGIQVSDDEFVPVDYEVLRRARRRAIIDYLVGGSSTGLYASNPVIAEAVATLVGDHLGGTVVDPFCGTGSFLWALMDRLVQSETIAEFRGYEQNPVIAGAAGAIGASERARTTIAAADAYDADLPEAQVVVTAPPLGVRLQKPHQMSDGSMTIDGEAAAVDVSLRTLQSGGRAVFHLGAGFTFKAALERYRQYLASEFRVAALIGLPSGAVPGTGISSVLLVVDRADPGQTFVAQLGEDWETQLSREGAALEAARAHLDGDGPSTLGTL
ncbi:N-6 DNA methylase [Mycolicibacterium houstonense]|uniref:N-6 DNA methylase n=1 Tax=Mycolicibacterium houstonense TaxID=146021 RepID=UPI003F9DFB7C